MAGRLVAPEPPVATREPRRRRRSIYCVFISPR